MPGGTHAGSCDAGGCGSMTSGLVGEMNFKFLPDIPPWLTFLLALLSMLVKGHNATFSHNLFCFCFFSPHSKPHISCTRILF